MSAEKKPVEASAYKISVTEVKPHLIAAAKGWAKMSDVSQQIHVTMDIVWKFVKENGIENDGQNVVIYRMEPGASFENEGCAIFCGPGIKKPFEPKGGVAPDETPGGTVATTRHVGPYSEIHFAHDAIHKWSGANKRLLKGACWEVYGHWNEHESKLVTDIFYQL